MSYLFLSRYYDVSRVPVDSTCDPWSRNSWQNNNYQPWSCRHQEKGSVLCPALCAGLCSKPALHREKFLLRVRLDNTVRDCCYCQQHQVKSRLCPLENCRDSMRRASRNWSSCLLGSGCFALSHNQRHQWTMVSWWHPSEWDGIKAGVANFWSRGRELRWICASCFACAWSCSVKQNSFSPSKWKRQISRSPL